MSQLSNILKIGEKAPSFSAVNQHGNLVRLEDFKSNWLILYFYPKDNTPGCTLEAKDFSEYKSKFEALGAKIIGVSPDSQKSHCKFINKYDLSINLLSDVEQEVCEAYRVWQLKKFMGKEYMGVVRSTFLITPDADLAHIWSNVRTKGHAQKVFSKLQELLAVA
ncbi:MAG: thioredoxin-dependent thiol peroxidase [Rivularia sp. (in: Bacteria)]|nr:thioredoxin-dependent thiol peroxidase [Rivularia sp. MS3]